MASYQNYSTVVFDDLKQMLYDVAKRLGDRTLLIQQAENDDESYTYRRYRTDVAALGTALLSYGLGGKNIIVIGENCYHWITAYMAVVCGVGTVVPVSPTSSAKEIAEIAKRTNAAAVIYSSALTAKIHKQDPLVTRICFDLLPELIDEGKEQIRHGDYSYLNIEIDADAPQILQFTATVSGEKRMVMLSHRNVCFAVSELCHMVRMTEKDVFLSALPLHHTYQSVCGFLCPLSLGATVAFCEDLRHLSRDMRHLRPTVMLCVPLLVETLYENLIANVRKMEMEKKLRTAIDATNAIPDRQTRLQTKRRLFANIQKSFGGRLRLLLTNGTSTDLEALKGFCELGITALQGYGLPECSALITFNRDTCQKAESVGMTAPHVLLDIDDMGDDGIGEIRLQGDNIMRGYYQDPDATAAVIRNGWFYTGDLGYMDEEGFLYVVGRKKNAITDANGKNIYPEELERALNKTAFVKESVVVSYRDPQSGTNKTVAIIHPDFERLQVHYDRVLTAVQIDLEMKKAVSEANSTVPAYNHISDFVIRSTPFPKNTSRKIKRQGMAEEHLADYLTKCEQQT